MTAPSLPESSPRGRSILLLAALLGAACAEPPPPPAPREDPAERPAPPGVEVEAAWGRTPRVYGRVHHVAWERLEDGSLLALIDLALDLTAVVGFDGMRTYHRTEVLQRKDLSVVVDGETIEAPVVRSGPGLFGERLDVPANGRRIRGILEVDLGQDEPPEQLTLRLGTQAGLLEIPVLGGLTDASGAPSHAVEVMSSTGALVTDEVTVLADGTAVEAAVSSWWRIPVGTTEITVSAPGSAEVRVAPSGPLTSVVLRPDTELAAGLPTPSAAPGATPLDTLADSLRTSDQVASWVVDNLGLIPSIGLQRSPEAVLRLGAGSPIERAELARFLLLAAGIRSRLTCGDLPPEATAALYAHPPDLPHLPGELGELARRTAERAEALETELAPVVTALSAHLLSQRGRDLLVPEWCDVEARHGDAWTTLDLRPRGADTSPDVATWRVTDTALGDTWRVALRFTAVMVDGPPDRGGVVETRDLLVHETTPATLSDRAAVFDLFVVRGEGGRQELRSLVANAGDAVYGAKIGTPVAPGDLDHLLVALIWTDPYGQSVSSGSHTLWERRRPAGPDIGTLRAVFTSDSGTRSGEALAAIIDAAAHQQTPTPAITSVVARHRAFDLLRAHAAGGLEPASPSLQMSVWEQQPDHRVHTGFVELTPGLPAGIGGDLDRGIARLAAAHAAAREVVFGPTGLAAPTSWARRSEDTQDLRRTAPGQQVLLTRGVNDGRWVGYRDDDASLWTLDTQFGGLTVAGGYHDTHQRIAPEPAPADTPVNDPMTVHRTWRRGQLCADLPLWRTLRSGEDVPLPPTCSPAAP